MLKKLALLLCLSFITSPVLASDEICSDEFAAEVYQRCGGLKTRKAQKKCITKAATTVMSLKGLLGSEFTGYITATAKKMKLGKKIDPDYDIGIKAEPLCIDLAQITKKISNKCCNQKYKNKRRSCLTSNRNHFKALKQYSGVGFFSKLKSRVSRLLKAPSCGAGGESTNGCDVMRSLGGGFLHKYPSDHGNVALLLPSYDSASACDYITTRGERLFNLRYYYRANGNRQHWRPYSGGYCGDFRGNRPVYAHCKIRGQWHCWNVWNPCTRVE